MINSEDEYPELARNVECIIHAALNKLTIVEKFHLHRYFLGVKIEENRPPVPDSMDLFVHAVGRHIRGVASDWDLCEAFSEFTGTTWATDGYTGEKGTPFPPVPEPVCTCTPSKAFGHWLHCPMAAKPPTPQAAEPVPYKVLARQLQLVGEHNVKLEAELAKPPAPVSDAEALYTRLYELHLIQNRTAPVTSADLARRAVAVIVKQQSADHEQRLADLEEWFVTRFRDGDAGEPRRRIVARVEARAEAGK